MGPSRAGLETSGRGQCGTRHAWMRGGGREWGRKTLGTTEPRPVLGDGRDGYPVTVVKALSLWPSSKLGRVVSTLSETEGKSGSFLDGVQSTWPAGPTLGASPAASQRLLRTPSARAPGHTHLAPSPPLRAVTRKAVPSQASDVRKQAFRSTRGSRRKPGPIPWVGPK